MELFKGADLSKTDLIYLAQCSEQADDYFYMTEFMKVVVKKGDPLSETEFGLLSYAFKHHATALRSSILTISDIIKEETEQHNKNLNIAISKMIEKELKDYCNDFLDMLDTQLFPKTVDEKLKISMLKYKGDFYRYKAEVFEAGKDRDELIQKSKACYEEALEKAIKNLKVGDVVRLGVMINASIFYYDLVKDKEKAVDIAKKALEESTNFLVGLKDDESKEKYKNAHKTLLSNLKIWDIIPKNENDSDDDIESES